MDRFVFRAEGISSHQWNPNTAVGLVPEYRRIGAFGGACAVWLRQQAVRCSMHNGKQQSPEQRLDAQICHWSHAVTHGRQPRALGIK